MELPAELVRHVLCFLHILSTVIVKSACDDSSPGSSCGSLSVACFPPWFLAIRTCCLFHTPGYFPLECPMSCFQKYSRHNSRLRTIASPEEDLQAFGSAVTVTRSETEVLWGWFFGLWEVSPVYSLSSALHPTPASVLSWHKFSALALVVYLPEVKRQGAGDGGGSRGGILPRPLDAASCRQPALHLWWRPPTHLPPLPLQGRSLPRDFSPRVAIVVSFLHFMFLSLLWFPQGWFFWEGSQVTHAIHRLGRNQNFLPILRIRLKLSCGPVGFRNVDTAVLVQKDIA